MLILGRIIVMMAMMVLGDDGIGDFFLPGMYTVG